jgi:methylase of polypeptide subunit release factors
VLEDVMFGEFDSSSRVAIPAPDTLLFVRDGNDQTTAALREATRQRYEAASQPLTTTLFQFRRSKPKPVQ